MKLRFASAIALSIAASAHAETYRFELNAGLGQGEVELGPFSNDFDTLMLGGTFYFSDVDTSQGPLREAAFLDKASGLSFTRTDMSFDDAGDNTFTTIDGRFVLASDTIIEASVTRMDDGSGDDSDTISVGAGTYINENSDVVATYTRSDGGHVDTLGIDYHTIVENGNASWGIDLGASYVDTSFDSGYGLTAGATFYPSANFGLGATLSRTSVGYIDATSLLVGAEYFFNSNFSGELIYSASEEDSVDLDQISVGVSFRF